MRGLILISWMVAVAWFGGCTLSGESSSRFASQPEDVRAGDGDGVYFSVRVKGQDEWAGDAHTYTWYKDGVALDPEIYGGGPTIRYVCSHADDGARFKVTVSKDGWSETSRTARLRVTPRPPRIERVAPYDVSTTLPIPFWISEVDTVRSGSAYKLRPLAIGTGLTYRWHYKGVWTEYADSTLFALPTLRKSDSGQVVTLIVSNAFGSDTATYPLKVFYPPWEERPLYMASQNHSQYGSLVDLDVPKAGPLESEILALFPGTSTTANQERLDLVLGLQYREFLNEDYMLLSPRRAWEKGIASATALDPARLADSNMVIIPRGTGRLSQEQAWQLYEQGVKRDSVLFHEYGRYGGVHDSWLLVRTDAGRLVVLTHNLTTFGATGPAGYWYLAFIRQGSVRD